MEALGVKPTNFRNETRTELKMANKAWIDCVSKNFLNQWLSGADVKINEVCVDEHTRMTELDTEVYEPMPFKKDSI
jgi:hypothetical protein